jgi:calnexin
MVPNPKCESAPGCGEYEAPLIKNSAYKGKWRAPTIPNPAYAGPWKPRQIPNPNYVEDLEPHNFEPLIGAGFELWMVNDEIGFNNIFIGTDEAAVHAWNKAHFVPKFKIQEQEQKKLEPTPKPYKNTEKKGGFLEALSDFGQQLANAWTDLYEEHETATVAVTTFLFLVPVLIGLTCCCWPSKPKQQDTPKPAKVEDNKEEKKVDDDGAVQRAPQSAKSTD